MRDGFVPWPDAIAEEYVNAGYWRGQPLGHHLWEAATRWPDRVAVVCGEERLSYLDLLKRSDRVASGLAALGLRAGDNVLVQLPNSWEFVVMTIACLRLNVAPVMAMPAHRRSELAHVAGVADARAIIVPDSFRGFAHQALAVELASESASIEHVVVVGGVATGCVPFAELVHPDGPQDPERIRQELDAIAPSSRDVAVLLLSGGTTGLPKLISRTHDDYEYNARRSGEVCGFDADTVYLVALPAGHNFPLACPGILGTLLVGGRVVLVDSPEPTVALAAMHDEGVNVTACVPAVAMRWLEAVQSGAAEAPTSLQVLQVGGARLAPEVAQRVRPTLGCTLQQVFGMAEGLLNYTRLDDPEDIICETQGRPMSPGDEILVVDELDRAVLDGAVGSLLTRGPCTPRGYFRAAEHNASAFTADGWYRTGDVVRVEPGGNLVVLGRTKDLINRGGEKISAEEIENLVHAVAPVAQVAAVAMPDAELGERICVYAVPRLGEALELAVLRSGFEAREVARFKFPERLEIVDALPVTSVGKIDKQALRDDIAQKLEAEANR